MAASKVQQHANTLLAQRQAIVGFGRLALQSSDLDHILNEACRLTADALGTELAKVMELQDDGRQLLVIAGVGWKDGVVGEETVPAVETSSEGYALKTGVPTVSSNISKEDRFDYAAFLKRHGVKSIVNVVIPGAEGQHPYGLLQVDSCKTRKFDQNDIEFLQGYANLLGAAIERNRAQQQLAQSLKMHERLFAELQHRINNNLSVIASLLRLKARRSAHPAVQQEISEVLSQIDVLREIHKKLHASGTVDEIDLGGYLSSLCASIANFGAAHREDVRIETRSDVISIDPAMAVPIGLITNEFVTNSLKHCGEQSPLVVSIDISRSADSVRLVLRDNGPGMGEARRKKEEKMTGSGLMLIDGLLEQLHSKADWGTGKNGASLTITIPMSSSLARPRD